MRFARVRSGLAESFDEVAAVAVDETGRTLYSSGAVNQPIFYRSAIKPFQAIAAARTGLSLPREHLAVTCASHSGYPVHLAIIDSILTDHGLTTRDLQTTPGRPLSYEADMLQVARGNVRPEPRFHNCSGKHAGWLAACTVAGWDLESYLDPHHPLQVSILDVMAEFSGADARPVGVDGCGAPTLRGSIITLARAFSRLSVNEEAVSVATAMTAYGALVSDNIRGDGRVGVTWGGPQKRGAEGSFAMSQHGIAIATKSESGTDDTALAAALVVAGELNLLPEGMSRVLADQISPPVIGAGSRVGRTVVVER
ncbi:MAG: asparaginase [Acidimicrobiia bacterium]